MMAAREISDEDSENFMYKFHKDSMIFISHQATIGI